MLWPDFNELGDLPVGIYRAKIADVVAHFGRGSAQRAAVTARLERIYQLARSSGCLQKFIIFGSYVTAEPKPHDVDVFLVMRGGFQPRDAPPETQGLFRHGTAQSEFGASIFWVNAGTSFADTEDLIVGWQTRRDLQRRGIVEVMEHD
ncbi:MAG: DUF6932 family protein [Terriglobia bacterium]